MKQKKQQDKGLFSKKHQFTTFEISDHLFGINILDVKEIIDEVTLTKIYHAPDEILGFVNIRGQVYLVLDLRVLLNFEKKNIDESSRVLIFTPKVGEFFGVMVDRIGHMEEVDERLIEYRQLDEARTKSDKNYQKSDLEIGTCKLMNRLMIILDAIKLLEAVDCS